MKSIFVGALGLLVVAPALAQSLKFQPKNSDEPMEVTADNGLELQQDNKRAIARGNARLVQGDVSVTADELIADYRTKSDGGDEIYRMFANGHVVMKSASETASGSTAVYDFDKAVLVLEGDVVSLVSEDGAVTARQALQYWSNERVAVAEGSAHAEDKQKRRINGDKLIAFFREDGAKPAAPKKDLKGGAGRSRGDIAFVQAFGNVRVETATEIVRSERGTYNIDTGIATLDGGVKVTRDNSQLAGGFAVVNMKGGVTKVFGSAAQAGMTATKENPRVKALVAPKSKPEPAADPAQKPAAPAKRP